MTLKTETPDPAVPPANFGVHQGAPETYDPAEVEASPDIMSGSRPPQNANSANKRPIMLAAGVIGLIGVVLVASIATRGGDGGTKGLLVKDEAAAQRSGDPATIEVLQGAPEGGVVPAATLVETDPIMLAEGEVGPNGQPPQLVAHNPGTGVASNPHDAAWQAYYQQREQARQGRYEQARSALTADSGVSYGRQQAPQANSAGQNPMADLMRAMGQGNAAPAAIPASMSGQAGYTPDNDLNRQGQKNTFLNSSGGRNPYAEGRIQNAISPYELKAGTVIPITLITGVNSDLPGQVVAQVRQNVYDTASGRHLLVPQGARLIGTYDSAVTTGQTRVLLAWNRIIYPDGSSIDIGSMPGSDQAGFAGMNDRVDNHYRRTFGNAVFLSLFSAGIQLSQPQASQGEQVTSGQTVAAQLGQQLGQLGMETARRNMQIQPTLRIRQGALGNVQLTQDLVLRPQNR